MVNAPAFERAEALVAALGRWPVNGNKTLADELSLGTQVSLWETLAPTLLLYRFPLLFPENAHEHNNIQRHQVRAYRAWLASQIDRIRPRRRSDVGCAHWPEEPTALLLGFAELFDRDVLQPVARQLGVRRRLAVATAGIGPSGPHPIWTHGTEALQARLRDLRTRLHSVRRTVREGKLSEQLENSGISVPAAAVRAELDRAFWRDFPALIPQLAIAEHILAEHPPSVIVSPDNADPRCRLYLLLGRRRGVPRLLVQQGLAVRTYPDWRFLEADRVAVMGETSVQEIVEQGVPRDAIVITGHPGFDVLTETDEAERSAIRASFGVGAARSLVLFGSQPYVPGSFPSAGVRTELLTIVASAARTLTTVRFLVKPHPSEDARELRRLFSGSGAEVVDASSDIRPLLRSVDVFVTFFSTTGLQALVAGTPVVNVVWPGGEPANMYAGSGATWVVRSPVELTAVVNQLTGSDRDSALASRQVAIATFVRRWAYAADGGAAARVADAAEALAAVTA